MKKQVYSLYPLLSGVIFVGLFAYLSTDIAQLSLMKKCGISSLIIAILLGILYGNTLHHRFPKALLPGILFSAKKLLRLAIILYGFRISFQDIISVGMQGLILDSFVVIATLGLGTWVGIKFFKLDRHMALLISAGAAICGAAAVLAIESILKCDANKTSVAVGTVVLFGTLAMFLYPILQQAGFWGFDFHHYGLFTGASIHEVAQVVTAGNAVSPESSKIAVIVKMTRVLMLVPVLLYLSYYESKYHAFSSSAPSKQKKSNITVPWFALLFVVMIGVNSLHIIPVLWIHYISLLDTFLLTMAMSAIGMETQLSKIRKVGLRPLYLATFLFGWLVISVFLWVKLLT